MIRLLIATVLLGVTIFFVMIHNHSKPIGNLLSPLSSVGAWQYDHLQNTQGTMIIDGSTAQFDISQVDGTDYHVQFYSRCFALEEGRTYRLRFEAKADKNRAIPMSVTMNQQPFTALGLTEVVHLTPEWVQHDYKFTASSVDRNPDRIPNFLMGEMAGTVWIKDIELKEVD